MNDYLKADEWSIIEEGFDAETHMASESIFSLGNGRFGQRANFEETYSGDTLQGSYVGGIYYPDKTRVGWWKNGYPEYFAKVMNSPNWTGIGITVDGESLDLSKCKVEDFIRTLNMKEGTLSRSFKATLENGCEVRVEALRFISVFDKENAAISYSVTPLNSEATLTFSPELDGDVYNEDSNYGEQFWSVIETQADGAEGYLQARTNKLDFHCAYGMKSVLDLDGETTVQSDEKSATCIFTVSAERGKTVSLTKYASVLSSLNHPVEALKTNALASVHAAAEKGFAAMLADHKAVWAKKWELCDIRIEGDVAAQQAIRFNIFQLHQTYTGDDARLNVGPKGFTGEKYGGATYWDTEAYCVPFFLCTAPPEVTRNLLEYRYLQLDRAIENAAKLGFTDGAALYPMVTMNGEECHNEWEITFEEIHRNGAIAYAVYNYIRHTGDEDYLLNGGLDVLVGISRFWSQRVTWSAARGKFVMLGVTGPNEYENNINNNWYTNRMAVWCMKYTIQCLEKMDAMDKFPTIGNELPRWKEIIEKLHFPQDEKRNIFLQQDGYLDKEQVLADDLDPVIRPINQFWSWDRILRSCFIKQADTLQGIYAFEEEFDTETIRRNFDFYEPRTVHESSLSPCVHSILATRIGRTEKAYEMYLRTARLDLDDYNCEVHEGLHITSMAGTWMSVVEGFGGKRVQDGELRLNPSIPKPWNGYAFKILFKGSVVEVRVNQDEVTLSADKAIRIALYGQNVTLEPGAEHQCAVQGFPA